MQRVFWTPESETRIGCVSGEQYWECMGVFILAFIEFDKIFMGVAAGVKPCKRHHT